MRGLERITKSLKSFGIKAGLISALTASSLLGNGCGGSGGNNQPPAPPAPPVIQPLSAKQVSLANRLNSGHLDNGAFDWVQSSFPYNTAVTGFQNVTGITGLGLAETHLYDQMADGGPQLDPTVGGNLQETRDYLVGVMDDFNNNTVASVSLPNFMYIALLRQNGMVSDTQWEIANDAFTKLMLSRDATDGTVPGVASDGIFNRIENARTGQGLADLVGWDTGFIYKALAAMNWPENEKNYVLGRLEALPFHYGQPYATISAAHLTEILAKAGRDPAVRLEQLEAALTDEGVNGVSVDGDHQSTAYGTMALSAVGRDVEPLKTWLGSEIGPVGEFYEPASTDEYFEMMGEALQALMSPSGNSPLYNLSLLSVGKTRKPSERGSRIQPFEFFTEEDKDYTSQRR